MPRTGQSQFGGPDPAAEGDDHVRRRRHRLGHLQRPRRHPLPQHRRLREGARRAEGSGQRLLRPAGHLDHGAPLRVSSRPLRAGRAMSGAPGSLKGMRIGIIRESMLTFPGVKSDEPIVTAALKEIKTVLGGTLGATLVESVDPLCPDDPRDSEHESDLLAGAGGARAGALPGDPVSADAAGHAALPGVRGPDQADRIRPGQSLRHRHHGAHRLHGPARRRRRADSQEPEHQGRFSNRPNR